MISLVCVSSLLVVKHFVCKVRWCISQSTDVLFVPSKFKKSRCSRFSWEVEQSIWLHRTFFVSHGFTTAEQRRKRTGLQNIPTLRHTLALWFNTPTVAVVLAGIKATRRLTVVSGKRGDGTQSEGQQQERRGEKQKSVRRSERKSLLLRTSTVYAWVRV